MADRRCEKRFNLTAPTNGAFRVFPDVVVNKDAEGEWVGISRQPVTVGETFILTVVQFDSLARELPRRVPVRVIESRPVLVDGQMHHHIRLHSNVLAPIQFEQQLSLKTGELDLQPVLTQESSVRVVNVSLGGCLFESRLGIDVRTIATLQLQLDTEDCREDVEVVRCEMIRPAPALYHVAVRLLRTRARQPGTIRHAVARHLQEATLKGSPYQEATGKGSPYTDLDRPGVDRVN